MGEEGDDIHGGREAVREWGGGGGDGEGGESEGERERGRVGKFQRIVFFTIYQI